MGRKILRINMSDLSANYAEMPEKWAKWAGRGLTSAIVVMKSILPAIRLAQTTNWSSLQGGYPALRQRPAAAVLPSAAKAR